MLRKFLFIPALLSIAAWMASPDAVLARGRGGRGGGGGGGHAGMARGGGFRGGAVRGGFRAPVSRGVRRAPIYRGNAGFARGYNRGYGGNYGGRRYYSYGYPAYGYGGLGYGGLGYGGLGYGGLGYGYGGYGLLGGLGYGLLGNLGYGGYGYGSGYGGYGSSYGGYGSSYYPYGGYGYNGYGYSPNSGYYGNYTSTPTYGPGAGYAQSPAAPVNSATVRVIVPNPQAQVWFDGAATHELGTNRLFTTPSLTAAGTYHIRATWMENGHQVSQERVVTVNPSASVVVDFTKTLTQAAPQAHVLPKVA